jgi:DNA-directed RNA polymerase specialized sigma24 family protein
MLLFLGSLGVKWFGIGRGTAAGAVRERLRIEAAVAQLPDQLREPFVLIDVLGFSYQETAAILSTRVGTVKSRMHRARAALIESLGEGDVADEM